MCCFWKKLQQWQNKVGNNGGQKVTLVAVAHLVSLFIKFFLRVFNAHQNDEKINVFSIPQVIIVWGLILTFEDIHIQHYPFSLHEIVYVLGYYMVHLLLVASLVTGTFKVSYLHSLIYDYSSDIKIKFFDLYNTECLGLLLLLKNNNSRFVLIV